MLGRPFVAVLTVRVFLILSWVLAVLRGHRDAKQSFARGIPKRELGNEVNEMNCVLDLVV